jgi:hypothetical protein
MPVIWLTISAMRIKQNLSVALRLPVDALTEQ